MTRVEIGAWDWQSSDWESAYYPADLPQEWRPAYYAHDFACVGLPPGSWRLDDLTMWLRETGENLQFWLGCDAHQLTEPGLADALSSLGPRLAGVFFENTGQGASNALIGSLRARGSCVSYVAEPPSSDIEAPWRGTCSFGLATLNIYRPEPGDDVRKRRAMLERFVQAPGPELRYLLIAGPPAIAEECRQLCVLLGI